MNSDHLTEHRLSELGEFPATAIERAHLLACDACREAAAEYAEMILRLGRLPDLVPPAGLRERVMEQRRSSAARAMLRRSPVWARRAAAAAVFVSGALTGALVHRFAAADPPHRAQARDSINDTSDVLTTTAGNPRARLALLNALALTTRAALADAPTDPGIQWYHNRVAAERQAATSALPPKDAVRWF